MDPTAVVVQIIEQNEVAFLLILIRVGAFVTALPILGGGGTPLYVKALMTLVMTLLLFPVVHGGFIPPSPNPAPRPMIGPLVFAILSEIVIGLMIGFAVRLIFAAVEIGAEVAGMQMGFGLANAFDPVSNQQVSLIRQIYMALASVIFLSIDGHHLVLQALVKSFEWISAKGFLVRGPLIDQIIRMGSDLFLLGMKISAPVVIALLLTQMAMGIISRVVPQLQIFLFSFALTIGIGLIVFGFSLSLYANLLQNQMTVETGSRLMNLLATMR